MPLNTSEVSFSLRWSVWASQPESLASPSCVLITHLNGVLMFLSLNKTVNSLRVEAIPSTSESPNPSRVSGPVTKKLLKIKRLFFSICGWIGLPSICLFPGNILVSLLSFFFLTNHSLVSRTPFVCFVKFLSWLDFLTVSYCPSQRCFPHLSFLLSLWAVCPAAAMGQCRCPRNISRDCAHIWDLERKNMRSKIQRRKL